MYLIPPLSLEEVAFMPEESDFLYIRTPSPLRGLTLRSALLGKAKASVVANNACYALSLLSKSESYLSLIPPLSLEEVAFMPEESDLLYIRTPSPFRALPLIQE